MSTGCWSKEWAKSPFSTMTPISNTGSGWVFWTITSLKWSPCGWAKYFLNFWIFSQQKWFGKRVMKCPCHGQSTLGWVNHHNTVHGIYATTNRLLMRLMICNYPTADHSSNSCSFEGVSTPIEKHKTKKYYDEPRIGNCQSFRWVNHQWPSITISHHSFPFTTIHHIRPLTSNIIEQHEPSKIIRLHEPSLWNTIPQHLPSLTHELAIVEPPLEKSTAITHQPPLTRKQTLTIMNHEPWTHEVVNHPGANLNDLPTIISHQ